MKKKRKMKAAEARKQATVANQPMEEKARKEPQPEQENRFDFGGLPDRDLKKNLGCG